MSGRGLCTITTSRHEPCLVGAGIAERAEPCSASAKPALIVSELISENFRKWAAGRENGPRAAKMDRADRGEPPRACPQCPELISEKIRKWAAGREKWAARTAEHHGGPARAAAQPWGRVRQVRPGGTFLPALTPPSRGEFWRSCSSAPSIRCGPGFAMQYSIRRDSSRTERSRLCGLRAERPQRPHASWLGCSCTVCADRCPG